MDVTKPDTIHAAAEAVSKLLPSGLDHLISNAGVTFGTFEGMDTFQEL
jgi:NAD(P)-dependent dehydrogenase (short-subunit alcohol dehydrogenase family)